MQTKEKRKPNSCFSQKSNKRRFAETNKSTTFVGDLENRDYVFLIISLKKELIMTYSHEVEHMCVVKKGPNHGPAPIPEEG